jgi:phage regulator Rha-like protein
MFRLTKKETEIWQSQIVTLIRGKNIKYTPIVFTEQGVAMLSSVLKSERAIQVNVQIIRTFTQMRKIL